MRRSRLRMLTLVLALLVLPALAEDRILDFHSDIKHGIFRDFPTRYEDKLGQEYVVGFNAAAAVAEGGSCCRSSVARCFYKDLTESANASITKCCSIGMVATLQLLAKNKSSS